MAKALANPHFVVESGREGPLEGKENQAWIWRLDPLRISVAVVRSPAGNRCKIFAGFDDTFCCLSEMNGGAAAEAEERLARARIKSKIGEVTTVAQSELSPLRDHINFTLQQAYFKCAYECFDRRKTQTEITKCSEHCSVPITSAQNCFENEMFKFQERLNKCLVICQDNFEVAKLEKPRAGAVNEMEQCVQRVVDDIRVKALPQLVSYLDNALSISKYSDTSPPLR